MSDKKTLIHEIYHWIADNAPERVKDMGNLVCSKDVNHLLEGINRILETHSSVHRIEPQVPKKMTEEKYSLAEAMKMKEIKIHTGIRSCPKPIEHEGETHYGTHKFMKKPEFIYIEHCRLCDYFLAESQEHQQIICCYEDDQK